MVPQVLLRSLSALIPLEVSWCLNPSQGLSALQSPSRSLSTLIPLTYLPLQNLVPGSYFSLPPSEKKGHKLPQGGVSKSTNQMRNTQIPQQMGNTHLQYLDRLPFLGHLHLLPHILNWKNKILPYFPHPCSMVASVHW